MNAFIFLSPPKRWKEKTGHGSQCVLGQICVIGVSEAIRMPEIEKIYTYIYVLAVAMIIYTTIAGMFYGIYVFIH